MEEATERLIVEDAEQRNQVLSRLLTLSTSLVSVLQPNELLADLARRVVEVVSAVQASLLWVYDRQQHMLQIAVWHGLDLGPAQEALVRLRLRPGEGLVGVALQRGESMLVEGRLNYWDLASRVSARNQGDVRRYIDHLPRELTAVVLPLRIGAEPIGVLELMNLGARPALRTDDLQILQTFANLAAGAIKNAQLHADMQAHQRRLQAFGAIGTVVSTAADLDELLRNVLDVILEVVEAPAAMLLQLNPLRTHLLLGAQRGLPPVFVEQQHNTPVNGASCEEAVRYGQPVRRPLLRDEPEEQLITAGFLACAHIPLLVGGTVIGVISIYGDGSLPERIDVQALMMMGNLIGFAIANVHLYQETLSERRRLSAVISSIAEGVALCDSRGRLMLANQTAIELLAIERIPYEQPLSEMPEFYAMRDLEGLPLPVERLPFTRALAGEVFHDYRLMVRGASGLDTVMSFGGAPVYANDQSQTVEGAVIIFRDVTASQRLERAKDDFLAVAAHELRSPLAAVRSYTDLLVRRQRRTDEDAPELRGLTILAQQVTHMLRMVDNLLDVSRLDAGQFSLQLQEVNLLPLIQQVIDQQRPSAGDRELVLETQLAELMIGCDPMRIRQVVTNLISNAIRYSPPNSAVRIRIALEPLQMLLKRHALFGTADAPPETLYALIEVQDQGSGMSEEQMTRLFKRYSRGYERRGEGLGLGLYLSREFITRHAGEIWVESQEGRGSTFSVALPLRTVSVEAPLALAGL